MKPLEEVNAIGRRYAELPEEIPAAGDRMVSNPEKENLLLELCQCFHPYLMKYLVMICRGRVPIVGHGNFPAYTNKDVKPFLMYFLAKGQKPTYQILTTISRTLHLAFKGMQTEEVYDVLMEQLVGALKGYDPNYKSTVKMVVEAANHEFSKRKQFSAAELNRHLDIDSTRYLRLLGRLGFLREQERAEKTAMIFGPAPGGRHWSCQRAASSSRLLPPEVVRSFRI